jgi:CRISPR system Cascade subunit CasE
MFLTKMLVNPARRGARTLIASPQALHAAVFAAFPDSRPTEEGRILWRFDTYHGHRAVLYVVSPDKPDFTHLVEQAGWPTTHAWETKSYHPLLESLTLGQRWHFRLTANPVHAARRDDWRDTKPLAHVTAKQQEQWLLDRTAKLGFQIAPGHAGVTDGSLGEPDFAVVARTIRRFNRHGSTVTVAMATFEGHLEVTDTAALRRALTHGVGRAKAYGCGLLTLARPNVEPER